MKLAVVGAGLAGLSVCYHALEQGFDVTLFDPKGIGKGASSASTGLLHPFAGKTASRSWEADKGMESTKKLLLSSEEALGMPVASYTGIFRPAVTEQQKIDFRKNKDALWKEISLGGNKVEGLWIPQGITVFSRRYLEGLWLACEKKGAIFVKERFSGDFDRVVLSVGSEIHQFEECKDLKTRTAIGQSLVCRWDQPLPFSVSSQGYIAVTEDTQFCQVGSTYEHTAEPSPQKAIELLDKVSAFYPHALDFSLKEIRSGKRIAPREGHKPIVAQVAPKTWVFTGLGSRGLLYHALLGKALARLLK